MSDKPILTFEVIQKANAWLEKIITTIISTAVGALVIGFFILLYNGFSSNTRVSEEQRDLLLKNAEEIQRIGNIVINDVGEIKADIAAMQQDLDNADSRIQSLESNRPIIGRLESDEIIPPPILNLIEPSARAAIQERRESVSREQDNLRARIDN